MKKALIALTSVLCIIGVAIGGLFIWEHQSKLELESQVEDYLDDCGIKPTSIDVHGRPYILYAMQDTASLTYVNLKPEKGVAKDQILVHRLSHGEADRLTRFVIFDDPAGDVKPIEREDGSFTSHAMVNGSKVTFSAKADGHQLSVFADGRKIGGLDVKRNVKVLGTAVTDEGVFVELEYASTDCGSRS